MMNTNPSRVRASAIVIMFALVPASAGQAQQHKGKQAGKAKTSQPAARPQARVTPAPVALMKNAKGERHDTVANHVNPTNESLVSTLHSTMTKLAQTDHHYNGRRAQAVREIDTAVKLLSPQAGPANPAIRIPTGRKIPLATSDAYLREAQQSLQSLESQMDISGSNPHKFIQAKTSVQNAIRELNLALNDL